MRVSILLFLICFGSIAAATDETARSPAHRQALEAFGEELATALSSGDGEFANRHFAQREFVDRVMRTLPLEGRDAVDFRAGFTSSMSKRAFLEEDLGDDFHFLGVRPFQGTLRPIVRIVDEDEGLAYIVLDTRIDERGKIWFDDYYEVATGQWASNSIRPMVMPMFAQKNRSFLERVFSASEVDYIEHFGTITAMEEQLGRGDAASAVASFKSLPEALRQLKRTQVIQLSALAQLDDREDEYVRALAGFAELFPDDPSVKFMLLDHHMLTGNWEKLLADLAWLDRLVGGDPYIDVLRANGMLEKEDWASAKRFAQRALETEPGLDDAHWTLVTVGIYTADHDLVAGELRILRDELGYLIERETLTDNGEFAGFLESAQASALFAGEE